MPAAFEPTIDYVVTKIPRFAFEKFPGADPVLTTSMKSVGEVMAIGRTFAESLQKALRGLETGLTGLDEIEIPGLGLGDDKNAVRAALAVPRPDRLLKVAQALRLGFDVELIHESCRIDPWFLREIQKIVDTRGARPRARPAAERKAAPAAEGGRLLRCAARHAFGAERGRRAGAAAAPRRASRSSSASTPAPPSSPRRPPTCIRPTRRRSAARRRTRRSRPTGRKVIILGGGPNRIGQGIEFDYCCCHAAFALEEAGFESIMVNCNPETVSTDYDTSDRLYFEPLTAEDVLEIVRVEQSRGELLGVIVQFGGQTPLKLAGALQEANVPILGTSPDAIDLAEDRDRFQKLLNAARPAPAEERHRPFGRAGAARRRANSATRW